MFLQTRETIYGHFLVCYLALFLLRVLEIKCFDNNVSVYDLIAFIRDFRVVRQADGVYINISMQSASPAEILSRTNMAVCANNPMEMFVTVWLGVLEISTGKLTAANAGHEYPVIKRVDSTFEIFKDKHGFVIGGMDNVQYKSYDLELRPGDKLFLYTDGVPEATDRAHEMFGTERMLKALNGHMGDAPEEILASIRKAVDAFVGDAEQFDDLTMLCLEYKGTGTRT